MKLFEYVTDVIRQLEFRFESISSKFAKFTACNELTIMSNFGELLMLG